MVQDNGDPEQARTEGEENQLLAQTETEGDLTVPEGTLPEETLPEENPIEENPIEENPIEEVEGLGGDDEIVGVLNKDPEESNDPVGNRVDANGGSVSLSFAPNEPNEGPTGSGQGADELDPAADPEPAAPSEGTEGSEGSEQAAA
jgi:hypothetical protein